MREEDRDRLLIAVAKTIVASYGGSGHEETASIKELQSALAQAEKSNERAKTPD